MLGGGEVLESCKELQRVAKSWCEARLTLDRGERRELRETVY
jgi:hypothetical protein